MDAEFDDEAEEAGDDLTKDIEGDHDAGEGDIEDRVVDLEDKLDELMAEFEQLMGGEAEEAECVFVPLGPKHPHQIPIPTYLSFLVASFPVLCSGGVGSPVRSFLQTGRNRAQTTGNLHKS
jgi:hypothetical protein